MGQEPQRGSAGTRPIFDQLRKNRHAAQDGPAETAKVIQIALGDARRIRRATVTVPKRPWPGALRNAPK
jgi:hypothetical protein